MALNRAFPHGRYPPMQLSVSSAASVSVIIPAYNSARWVADAVGSALGQVRPPHQVIVIDDGSTDDTLARLAPFNGRIVLERQPNRGVAAARNRGLALATGSFIAFLDADDTWHPRKLEVQMGAFRRSPSLGLLGTRTYDCSGALPDVGEAATSPIALEHLAVKNYLTTSSVMIRRKIVECVGPFDTSLQGPEDHDYWIRVAEAASVGVVEAPLTGYRVVPGSLSRRAGPMEAGVRRILGKLDKRGFWRGKGGLLRRHAYGYAAYASAFLHGDEGNNGGALFRILESLAWYPLPLSRAEAGTAFVRGRRLALLMLRCLSGSGNAPRLGGTPSTQGSDRAHGAIPDDGADQVEAEAHAAF
jgi:glycosyltransferase involved in cell wall biosynthesis